MISLREVLLQGIVAKLEAIRGDLSYAYGATLNSVERYRHVFKGEFHEVNTIADAPKIIVVEETEESDSTETVDTWTNTFPVSIYFIFLGENANSEELNAALCDLRRALFSAPWVGLGVNARLVSQEASIFGTDKLPMLYDGMRLTLNLTYSNQFHDPSQE